MLSFLCSLSSAKNASLLALVLQQVGLVLMVRYSRTAKQDEANNNATTNNNVPYIASTAVVMAEILKVVINLTLEVITKSRSKQQQQQQQSSSSTSIIRGIVQGDAVRLFVPALAYVIQNNLLFVALSNLSVPVYQVTNQGKLLTTAICSRLLLQKRISSVQYGSLVVLAIGVSLVQLSSMDNKTASTTQNSDTNNDDDHQHQQHQQNQLLGLVAVIASCFTSGFAGVYFEKMLKEKKMKKKLLNSNAATRQSQEEEEVAKEEEEEDAVEVSVYVRNTQLALWSIMLGLVPVFGKDWGAITAIGRDGFFQGYNVIVWGVVVCQAMTGLIVALVMKYADTILKGFATSVAVVVATLISIFIWDSSVDLYFVGGAMLVMFAVRLYTTYTPPPPPPPSSTSPQEGGGEKGKTKTDNNTRQTSKTLLSSLHCRTISMVGLVVLAAGPVVFKYHSLIMVGRVPTDAEFYANYVSGMLQQQQQQQHPPLGNDGSAGSGSGPAVVDGQQQEQRLLPRQDHQQCPVRDLSNYTNAWQKPKKKGTRVSRWGHCLRFQCLNDREFCDTQGPTNFEGPKPPCCVHILRDMAREFDRVMCHLGLEYFPAFGMLLGLTRADKLIPWTIDNDYIVTQPVLAAMEDLWDTASHLNHGVGFHFDQVYRICVTPSFADGKLLRWKVSGNDKSWYADSVYPFGDLFWVEQVNETMAMDQRSCYHEVSSLWPQVRRPVYNGTFYQNFPRDPNALLVEYFGESWRTPDAKKKSHGGTHCGRRREAEAKKAKRKAKKRQQQKMKEEEKANKKAS